MKREQKGEKKSKKREGSSRPHKLLVTLSDKEYNLMCSHLEKYRIQSKNRWARETLLAALWKKLEDDYPKLFDDIELRQ
ncbi:MAG: hypothetical protein ACRCZM_04310 [Bacteroidales bacterium]